MQTKYIQAFWHKYRYNVGLRIVNAYCQFSQQARTNLMQTYVHWLILTCFFILFNDQFALPNIIRSKVIRSCFSSEYTGSWDGIKIKVASLKFERFSDFFTSAALNSYFMPTLICVNCWSSVTIQLYSGSFFKIALEKLHCQA